MNQDEEHLRLLSIFHYVCAGLAALFACFPIFHLVIGLIFLLRPGSFASSRDHPPAFVGFFFVVFAGIMIVTGWAFAGLLAYAGRCLSLRKHYTLCLVVAGVACMFMPFGTVLGVFSIIVLVRPSVKMLFDVSTPPAFPK